MSTKTKILIFLIFIFSLVFLHPNVKILAADNACFVTLPVAPLIGPLPNNNLKIIFDQRLINKTISDLKQKYPQSTIDQAKFYTSFPIVYYGLRWSGGPRCGGRPEIKAPDYSFDINEGYHLLCHLLDAAEHPVELILELPNPGGGEPIREKLCSGSYTILDKEAPSCKVVGDYDHNPGPVSYAPGDINDPSWKVVVSELVLPNRFTKNVLTLIYDKKVTKIVTFNPTDKILKFDVPQEIHSTGIHTVNVYGTTMHTQGSMTELACPGSFTIAPPGQSPPTPTSPPPTPTVPPWCEDECFIPGKSDGYCAACYPSSQPVAQPTLTPLCDQISTDFRGACWACVNRTDGGHIWTAIGCLPTDFTALINGKIFPLGIGIAGGVAFLYFLYGAFLVLASAGNAEMIEQGKQIIMSALSGLLLIIFSVFLLKVIGVDILKLPGFG